MNVKLKVFVLILLMMMTLAIGMNTRKVEGISKQIINVNTNIIEQTMKSVVKVIHPAYSGLPATGFYIGNGIVVTAGHVAATEGITKVIFENGNEYNVLKQIVCPDYDCGFLIINGVVSEPILKFDDDELLRGDTLYILGNPTGYTFVVSKGIVSGHTDCGGFFGDIELLVYDCAAANGNSGSPVIDEEGEVVAVHVGSNGTGYKLGVNEEDIQKALEKTGLKYATIER